LKLAFFVEKRSYLPGSQKKCGVYHDVNWETLSRAITAGVATAAENTVHTMVTKKMVQQARIVKKC
jgi:hypothetical protein